MELLFEKPISGQWTHAELNLPEGGLLRKVFSLSKDVNGDITGSCDPNPFFNALTYDVEFPDGEIKEHYDNVIDEDTFSQEDEDVHTMKILDAIVYCRKDISSFDKDDMSFRIKSGK